MVYVYISICSMIIAFIFFVIRYWIYFPFIYSIDDFFWLFAAIFLIKYIFTNKVFLYYIFSFILFLILIVDELFQKYVYPLIYIDLGTFSLCDLFFYTSAFFIAVVIIFLIERKE